MVVSAPVETTLHPARAGVAPLTAEDMGALPRVGAPVASADGRTLVVPVTTYDLEKNAGRTRLWRVPLEGGQPVALTSEDSSSSDPALSPDGRRLAFARKSDDGKPQIFVMPLDGGEPQRVTDLPLGAFDPKWLPDGSALVCAGALLKGHLTPADTRTELGRREKDPVKAHVTEDRVYRFWDTWLTTGEVPHLFLVDPAGGAPRDLTPESTAWFDWMGPSGQYDIAPDGREVAYAGIVQQTHPDRLRSCVFVAPIAGGGEVRCLTPDHPADDLRPRYTPDGRAIVYGMTHDPEFYADRVRLMRYERASGAHEEWLGSWERSPVHWEFAADGRLWIEAEDAGRTRLFRFSGTGHPHPVTDRGSVGGVASLRDGRVVFTVQTLCDAPEVYLLGAAADSRPARLTHFTEPVLSRVAMGEVRELTFTGAYGEPVQMFVVLPPGYEAGKKYPLVQVIHGGPHAISADAFHFRWNGQAFAAPGYIAALVNFQGSTSWGQDFAKRIQGAHGDRPFEDVMKATDALIAAGWVDADRMAAAGGSYGGYMAAWIAGHTDRFRCIVNHAGVYDTLSQYASDVTQGRSASYGGEPWDGIDAIDRWNPSRFADGFTTPMLVLHGERDYRVPVTQGLECYGVLKAKGVPARLVVFPDENHWVLKPKNALLWYREVLGWLSRWLKA